MFLVLNVSAGSLCLRVLCEHTHVPSQGHVLGSGSSRGADCTVRLWLERGGPQLPCFVAIDSTAPTCRGPCPSGGRVLSHRKQMHGAWELSQPALRDVVGG